MYTRRYKYKILHLQVEIPVAGFEQVQIVAQIQMQKEIQTQLVVQIQKQMIHFATQL